MIGRWLDKCDEAPAPWGMIALLASLIVVGALVTGGFVAAVGFIYAYPLFAGVPIALVVFGVIATAVVKVARQ